MAGFFTAFEPWLTGPWVAGAGLLLGAIVGSFLAAVLIRWPQGQSALGGRSRCDACAAPLAARDLVPLLSYAANGGRCRKCAARIDPRHPGVELAGALIGAVAFVAHPLPLALATAMLGWWLLLVALLDLEHHWLPDRLTLPLIPFGLTLAWAGLGPPLADRIAGAAIGFAALWLIAAGYRGLRGREGLGGGDPKLLGGIGAFVGALHLPFILVGAGGIGLVSALLMRWRGDAVTGATRLPLGTFLALAAWPVWLVVPG